MKAVTPRPGNDGTHRLAEAVGLLDRLRGRKIGRSMSGSAAPPTSRRPNEDVAAMLRAFKAGSVVRPPA
jgi:hypothetical protein